MEAVSRSPLRRFLASTDLEELVGLREELESSVLDGDDHAYLAAALADWDDVQAVANLLMYPNFVPADERYAVVLRGLTDADQPYLRVAAAVGIAELDPAELDDDTRSYLVRAVLDTILSESGVLADRASYSITGLLHPADAPDAVEALTHPSAHVRTNLTQSVLGLIDVTGLAALLDTDGFVAEPTRTDVRAQLVADGVDLDEPAQAQRRPLMMVYVPSFTEWTG